MLDLTEAQRTALRWIVEQVQAGRLEERFFLTWEGGFAIPVVTYPLNAPRPPNELTEGALLALAHTGYVLADPPKGNRMTYCVTLLGRAYEAAPIDARREAITATAATLIDLRDFIAGYFNEDEFYDLCLALGEDYLHLTGANVRARARELVLMLARGNRLEPLHDALRRARPDAYRATFGG